MSITISERLQMAARNGFGSTDDEISTLTEAAGEIDRLRSAMREAALLIEGTGDVHIRSTEALDALRKALAR